MTGGRSFISTDSEARYDRWNTINVKVPAVVRNTYALNHLRYRVSLTEQITWGAVLFTLFAEESLRRRREHVEEFDRALEDQKKISAVLMASELIIREHYQIDLVVSAEQTSIDALDLCGRVDEDLRDEDFGAWSPFLAFLRERLQAHDVFDLSALVENERSLSAVPFARAAVDRTVGLDEDTQAIDHIVLGSAPLHEMPRELLRDGSPEARAAWVKERQRENIEAEFAGLFEEEESSEADATAPPAGTTDDRCEGDAR